MMLHALLSRAQDPYYISIDRSNGLPSNAVYDIYQDRQGFIWLAHNEGLSRYDGHEFKTFSGTSQTSRSGSNITQDKYGRIWYENFDGYLYYVQGDSLRSLKQAPTVGFVHYGILGDILVVARKKGFDIYDLASLRLKNTIPAASDSFGGGVATSEHYYICIGIDKLIDIRSDGTLHRIDNIAVGMIVSTGKDALILPSKGKSDFCYKIGISEPSKVFRRPPIAYIQKGNFSGNRYWFSTPQGTWAYDESGNELNNGKPYYKDKSISCVFKDREGNYWLGTTNEGILLIPDINVKLIGGLVPNLLLVQNNRLFAATRDNAIYSYDFAANVLKKHFQDSIHHEAILFQYDAVARKFFLAAQDFKVLDEQFHLLRRWSSAIKDICRLDHKYYAMATSGSCDLVRAGEDGLSVWDREVQSQPAPASLAAKSLVYGARGRAVSFAPGSNTLYCGTSKGLLYFQPDVTGEIRYNGEPVYASKLIYYRHATYALTTQNDLYRIDEQHKISPVAFSSTMQKPSGIKYSEGQLFLLAGNIINVLDTIKDKFVNLNADPAIPGNEINDFALYKGKLCIATDRGLLITTIQPASVVHPTPQLVINAVSANNLVCAKDSNPHFRYDQNDIQVNYSILSFKTGGKYPLYYRINSGDWQRANTDSRILKLVALSPGAYTIAFRLGEQEQAFPVETVSFSIAKPFWQQWWFFAACVLLLFALVYGYYSIQTNSLKRKNTLVLEKVELEKSLRNSMLVSIRSQMNPHFFYNALNTIQSFIFSDDKRNASTYLVKFSQLTRMILEMSEKESITLHEEVKALTFYLELEKMRFHNDFEYSIRITQDVDAEMIKIPPMIVQPFVENAVKHGLLHKKGSKLVTVDFSINKNDLVVTVEDNGIGRKRAGELNRIRNEKHKSFSTRANEKRIAILNKGRASSIGIAYVDKDGLIEGMSGTSVIITIPIIDEKVYQDDKSYNY